MNILISLPYFPEPGTGTGNAVYGISKSLIKSGASVMILAESHNSEKLAYYKDVPYMNFAKNKSWNPFKISSDLKNYIRANRNNIDLLVLNGVFIPYVYSLAMFAKSLNIAYVHVPHFLYNDMAFKKSPIKKTIYFKLFERKVIQNALAVQMFSAKQLRDAKKRTYFKNGIIIPNGVDLESLKNISSKKIRKNNRIRIIFFGRKDVFTKGLDLLIEAINQIDNDMLELDIVGSDSSNTSKIVNLISNLNIKNINLKDKYTGNPINLLQNYDFMIMPSRIEAFSMAILEAMLAGLPIITSEEVGMADHILKAKAGFVCEPNTNGIRVAIEKMLNRKNEWEKMGNNGRKYVVENLTWDAIGIKTLKTYKQLCSKDNDI